MTTLKFRTWSGELVNAKLTVFYYATSDQLAILVDDADTGEYIGDLSLFMERFHEPCSIVGRPDLMTEHSNFIIKNNLGVLDRFIVDEGICIYPVYKMDMEELRNYDPEGVETYLNELKYYQE